MNGHSPEPWTYDEVNGAVVDANGNEVADCMPFNCDLDCADTNGRRIAALSAENARLREALQAVRDAWGAGPSHEAAYAAMLRVRTALAGREVGLTPQPEQPR